MVRLFARQFSRQTLKKAKTLLVSYLMADGDKLLLVFSLEFGKQVQWGHEFEISLFNLYMFCFSVLDMKICLPCLVCSE